MKMVSRLLSAFLSFLFLLSIFPVCTHNVHAENVSENEHYTVLLLDVSKSMLGAPLEKEKEAAIQFCETLLNANQNNKIAIVSFNSSTKTICKFSNDSESMKSSINRLTASGGTNMNAALSSSNSLLSSVTSSSIIKNIVICSDGIPESGSTAASGPYTSADSTYYKYANRVYSTAVTLKNKYNVYSLGFFHSLSGDKLVFGQRLMNDIQNAGYYEVINPQNLNLFFNKLANDVYMETYTMENKEVSISCDYKYSDSFFEQSSYKYNHNLSIASCCLATAVMVSDNRDYNGLEEQKPPQSAFDMFSNLGFGEKEEIYFSPSYEREPEQDSIACAIAKKNLVEKDTSIIAVSIRGGGYKGEWAGNFNVGKAGLDHVGFRIAANKVLDELSSFLSQKPENLCSNIKFWITGYSRSAAVANLVAKSVHDSCQSGLIGGTKYVFSTFKLNYQPDDIFAYCFETPKNTTDNHARDDSYGHIFNIVNRIDPVPRVAPSQWGFSRYGKDCYLPSKETTGKLYTSFLLERLKYNYDTIDKHTDNIYYTESFKYYKVDFFASDPLKETSKVSQGVFLDNLIQLIAKKVVTSRRNYASVFQNSVTSLMLKLNSTGIEYETQKNIFELFADYLSEHFTIEFLMDIIKDGGVKHAMVSIVEGFCKAYQLNLTYSEISDAAELLKQAIVPMLTNLDLLSTAILNGKELIIPHKTETTLAWLMTLNGNYENANTALSKTLSGESSYRVAMINCPVNVSVYDTDGELRGAIIKNEVQDVGENSLSVYINDNGEKCFVLPDCEEFYFEIEGYDTGSMSLSFADFDFAIEEKTSGENYYDIPVQAGTKVTVVIDEKSQDGVYADVTVFDEDSNSIEASEKIDYSDAEPFHVSAISDNAQCLVFGGGDYYKGEFSQVTTVPAEHYEFIGWYCNGDFVSTELQYRFRVSSDIALVAKYALNHVDDDNDGICDLCGEMMTGENHCPRCGKVHDGGFLDKLVGFFHNILSKLFGAKY